MLLLSTDRIQSDFNARLILNVQIIEMLIVFSAKS